MKPIKVTVPGSIMLLGEHAVLFGEKALACAVDKYIHLQLTPRSDRKVRIDSALAQYESDLDQLAAEPRLSFVLAAVRRFAPALVCGFELSIRSEFSHTVGLGSSAAVTAGTVAALAAYSGQSTEPAALFDHALAVVHEVQDGRGSGTDLVASIYGSIVSYRVEPRQVVSLQGLPDISLYYAGYKTPTPEVLKRIEHQSQFQPMFYQQLYRLMGELTESAEAAVAAADWAGLGRIMNHYQGLMDALGVADLTLCDIIYRLRQSSRILGAKISGSGLGDCVLALGADPALALNYEQIPVAVSEQGVSIEHH
ncbi:mevalonate kinase family protein [Neptuniibacter halophilus]|uniref:mevalonate kinase family protein n=1 Tax=Neptuniibacter halophilus TaxID=651666 RepID=UPI0025726351|nr:GHMP kinase [Neptuniibacter halophilus]